MSAELELCPFCHARPYAHVQNTHSTVLNHPGRWRQAVWCDDCGAMGPERDTEAEAIAAWNSRPEPSRIPDIQIKGAA